MAEYTKGPWHHVRDTEFVSDSHHMAICRVNNTVGLDQVRGITISNGAGSGDTNARLIAAAPELLEALKLVAKEWEHNAPSDCYSTGPLTGDVVRDHMSCPGCDVQKAVTEAISKAEVK